MVKALTEVNVMQKDELYKLLDEMTSPDHIMDLLNAPKWPWTQKNRLTEDELFPLLQEFIVSRSSKAETTIRENAYSILGRLLSRVMEQEYCQFFIDSLAQESNKYVLHSILSCISRLQLPANLDISPIIACSKSDKWLVRHNAIMALGASDTDAGRDAVRYWVMQEDEKQYKFELIYANAALGSIGDIEDIALLEKHTHSHIRDIKDSAIYAIEKIRQKGSQT